MKISGQDIPPELSQLYDELISSNRSGSGAYKIARSRRSIKLSKKPRKPSPQSVAIDRVIDGLMQYHRNAGTPGINSSWRHARRNALLDGNIENQFWQPCLISDSIVLESIPTSVENLSPGPYNYRDPINRPSTPLYPAGSPSTNLPSYTGALIGEIYVDTAWRWRRTTFLRDPESLKSSPEAIFAHISGQQRIDTSNRASRPMLSLCTSIVGSAQAGPPTIETAAPLGSPWRHYWRYSIPDTGAPYYHGSIDRFIIQALPRAAIGSSLEAITLTCAPSPMLGRGWNNNTSVDIEWQGNETIYEPKPKDNPIPLWSRWFDYSGLTESPPQEPSSVYLYVSANNPRSAVVSLIHAHYAAIRSDAVASFPHATRTIDYVGGLQLIIQPAAFAYAFFDIFWRNTDPQLPQIQQFSRYAVAQSFY